MQGGGPAKSEYTFVAHKYDFYHKLARKAVRAYFDAHALSYDTAAMVRSETTLVQQLGLTDKTLEIGTVVEFDEAILQDVVQKSLQMSAVERSAWSQYSLPS